MDLNHYALEQMVAARLGEAREARRHSALVASLRDEGASRVDPGPAGSHGPARLLRWFLGVPGNMPPRARAQHARTRAGQ
jgi:hypothetical protein